MATVQKIASAFPKSLANKELVSKVSGGLSKLGFTQSNTLLATSLCCDEVSRPLEKDFGEVYGQNFSMGGLAGFPFGGATSFGAMAAHIPDNGNCLVVFGPHVGVSSKGEVGTTEREGRVSGGACCGSACAACNYVLDVHCGVCQAQNTTIANPQDVVDAQQAMVGNLLLPYAQALNDAEETMVELPMSLYKAQKEMMSDIISAAAPAVADPGKIALVGGVQINTPPGESDYFMPLQFELFDNKGVKQDDLMWD